MTSAVARAASRIAAISSPTKVGMASAMSSGPRIGAFARPRAIHVLLRVTRDADHKGGPHLRSDPIAVLGFGLTHCWSKSDSNSRSQ